MAAIGSVWQPNTWVSSGGWAINTWDTAVPAVLPPRIVCFTDVRVRRGRVDGVTVSRPRIAGLSVEKC